MSDWSDFYKKEIEKGENLQKFVEEKIRRKILLIKKIQKYSSKQGRLLETGCGSGVSCCYFSKLGYHIFGIDKDKKILELAKDIANKLNCSITFKKMDIKHLNFPEKHFDVVFSSGVLEHFYDEEIISIINEQLRVGKTVVFSVPSYYLKDKNRLYGDERLMRIGRWKEVLLKTNGTLCESFGYGFDDENQELLYNQSKNSSLKPPVIGFVLQ
jgi:2-polyprenyl-3-methyl-5-hydroxy-6-metoxy-1,4-benzoquinol methylase